MSTLVLPKLLLRPLTLWNLFVIASLGLLLGQSAWLVRGAMAIAGGPSAKIEGGLVAVLVGGAAIGALVGWTTFEVLSCPYSAVVPRLNARLRDEAVGLCVLVALIAGAVASYLAGPAAGAATGALSMLGFGLCYFGSDPRSRPRRGHGWLYIAVFLALVVVSPEVPRWNQMGLALAMLVAITLGPVLVLLPFASERRRVRALTDTLRLDPAYRDLDVRSGTWGLHLDAPRDGTLSVAGPLRTDLDWARATLHEAHGWKSGGWIGSAVRGGAVCTLLSVALVVLPIWNRSAGGGSGDLASRLARSLLGSLEQIGTFTAAPAFYLTLWFTMAGLGTPFLPVISAVRPLSRARRARVAWIASLLDDGAALLAIGATLGLLAAVAHALRPEVSVTPGMPPWVATVLALALAGPPARFARLEFLDTAHGQPSSLRQGVVSGVTILLLSFAVGSLVRAWATPSGLPVLPLGLEVLAWVAAVVAIETAWFLALRRHQARADFAA